MLVVSLASAAIEVLSLGLDLLIAGSDPVLSLIRSFWSLWYDFFLAVGLAGRTLVIPSLPQHV